MVLNVIFINYHDFAINNSSDVIKFYNASYRQIVDTIVLEVERCTSEQLSM